MQIKQGRNYTAVDDDLIHQLLVIEHILQSRTKHPGKMKKIFLHME
jgi:hypothetical protein